MRLAPRTLIIAVVVAAGFLLSTGGASAQATMTSSLDITSAGLVQDSGVDLAAQVNPPDTVMTVTNSHPFKTGMYLELTAGPVVEVLRVVSKTGDGPGFNPDTLTVERHLQGTSAGTFSSGTAVLAAFARFQALVNNIENIDTGAELTAELNGDTFEASDAYAVEPIDSSEPQIDVSDARQFIGGVQVRIDSETMTVLNPPIGITVGLNLNSNVVIEENLIFSAQTEIKISDASLLKVGWRLRMNTWFDTECDPLEAGPPEEMLIVGLFDDPLGVQDTMTVVRGTTILNILMNSAHANCAAANSGAIFAGQDRITVAPRGGSAPTHATGSPISIALRVARVNDHTLLSPVEEGLSSVVTIGSEQLQIRDVPGRHFHSSGATLATGPNGSTTLLRVSDAGLIDDGDVIRVESELMAVHYADPVCTLQPGAATIEPIVDDLQTEVDVSDVADFSVGCTIKMGTEEMRVDAATPGTPDTITMVRGYNDTTAAPHGVGPVTVGQDSARVTRGMYASTAVLHGSGLAIQELTNEANTVRLQRLSGIATHPVGTPVIDVDGLGGYTLTVTTNAATTAATINEFVGPAGAQTTFSVTNPGALQVGWVIIVNNEKMRITGVGGSTITVLRAVHGTSLGSHNVGIAIRGPIMIEWAYAQNDVFLGSTGRSLVCSPQPGGSLATLLPQGVSTTCETSAGPLGPIGSGSLALIDLWGQQLLPNTPIQQVTITPQLADVSGNAIPAAPSSTVILKVVQCPDVNGNGTFNAADTTLILRAAAGIDPPPYPPTMDVNLNGQINAADGTLARRVLFFTLPGGAMRCLPQLP